VSPPEIEPSLGTLTWLPGHDHPELVAPVDINKTVRRHLDVRKISFADMAAAVSQTDMAYGGITPIGLPPSWPILIDDQVAGRPWIVIGSGIRGSKIAIRGGDVADLPGVRVLPIAQR
jgi:prolyl-tRNA editing enzyme YbaK/EbsC (Cys-tRNA(Pro) deacylase)